MFDFEEIFPSGDRVLLKLNGDGSGRWRYRPGVIAGADPNGIFIELEDIALQEALDRLPVSVAYYFPWDDIDSVVIAPTAGLGQFGDMDWDWDGPLLNASATYPQASAIAAD